MNCEPKFTEFLFCNDTICFCFINFIL